MTLPKFAIKDIVAAGLFLLAAIAFVIALVFLLTAGHEAKTIWSLVGLFGAGGLGGGVAFHGWPSIVIHERRR